MSDKACRKISALISDVDGTLLTDKKILTPDAEAVVNKLHGAGILFTVASARPPRGLKKYLPMLKLTQPFAGFNGGIFVNPDLSVIEQHPISEDTARKAVDMILAHKMDVWIQTAGDWYVRDPQGPHVDHESHTISAAPSVVNDIYSVLNGVLKIVGVSDDFDLAARCEKDMQQALGNQATVARSQAYYLDITHTLANKGNAVKTLAKLLSVSLSETMTIGDGSNDVYMFRESGLSIAMGNADPAVQHEADFVTASNKEEGFAKAVQKYLLEGAV